MLYPHIYSAWYMRAQEIGTRTRVRGLKELVAELHSGEGGVHRFCSGGAECLRSRGHQNLHGSVVSVTGRRLHPPRRSRGVYIANWGAKHAQFAGG